MSPENGTCVQLTLFSQRICFGLSPKCPNLFLGLAVPRSFLSIIVRHIVSSFINWTLCKDRSFDVKLQSCHTHVDSNNLFFLAFFLCGYMCMSIWGDIYTNKIFYPRQWRITLGKSLLNSMYFSTLLVIKVIHFY